MLNPRPRQTLMMITLGMAIVGSTNHFTFGKPRSESR